jgi:hypothetical protein
VRTCLTGADLTVHIPTMLIPTMAGADAQAGDSPRERTGPAWFIMSLVVVNLIIDGAVEHGASRAEKAIQQSFSAFCLAVYTIEMLLRIVGFGVWHSHPPPRPRAYFKRAACLLGKVCLPRARALACAEPLHAHTPLHFSAS